VALVYILLCSDRSLYTGATKDLEKRLLAHGRGRASKYTRARLPVRLVYSAEFPSWRAALREELRIKRLPRRRKLALLTPSMRRASGGSRGSLSGG
jgi:putative endonuclease